MDFWGGVDSRLMPLVAFNYNAAFLKDLNLFLLKQRLQTLESFAFLPGIPSHRKMNSFLTRKFSCGASPTPN